MSQGGSGLGNATAPGGVQIGAVGSSLYFKDQALTAGAFTPAGSKAELPINGLPGISLAFTNKGANAMDVTVQYSVFQGTWENLGPAVTVGAGVTNFRSFDHVAARAVRFVVTNGTAAQTFSALLSACAT